MKSMDERIVLLTELTTKDIRGAAVVEHVETPCFCGVESVGQREFFDSGKNGLRPQYKMTVRREMYGGQKQARYKGQIYDIYRTYEAGKEYTELYLGLKEALRNAANGGGQG